MFVYPLIFTKNPVEYPYLGRKLRRLAVEGPCGLVVKAVLAALGPGLSPSMALHLLSDLGPVV